MNSRTRIQTAMDRGTPDRVPLMCQLSVGHMLSNLDVSPAEFWYDGETFASGLLTLRERYDFDGILVSLHGHTPEWRRDIKTIRKVGNEEEVRWQNGDVTIHPSNELPRHTAAAPTQALDLSHVSVEQLPASLTYIPVSQGLHFRIDPGHTFDILTTLRSTAGNSFSLHGEVTSPLDYYLDFVGLDNGLMGFVDTPETAEMILGHFSTLVADLASRMCAAGVDAIKISSPFAGAGFLSQRFYTRFVLPFEAKVASAVRAKGVHAYTHTCGAIGDRLELIFDAGVSGIECLDPPPLGNVELAEAKQRVAGRGFIKGNVDSVNVLLKGDRNEILEDAEQRILVGKQGGGFILSTACSVAPAVKPESIYLLREAVERWGS